MNTATLLKHFDRISEAPDAVARLRRSILDLAVRGKLVKQDPADEPAAELLQRIRAEKARLVNEGKIKKEKLLAPIGADETPFLIPASWKWARLHDITFYIQRGKSPVYATANGIPVVSQKCVQWRGLDLSVARLITKESIQKYEAVRFLQKNDLLWNSTGTGTIGRVVRIMSPPENLVCDSHVTVVRCALANAEYVRTWLCSDHVYRLIEDRAAGSTNQVELTAQMATTQVTPLPPLAEQHRIVAKVDELMALCDQLQAARDEREARRDRLVKASLHRLGTATPESFPAAARFHLDHLARLTTRPEHIKQLRQTILDLAVRGRLVPQDPNDEPATELLKRILAEKANLIKEGKLKPQLVLPSDEEKMPFRLAPGWQWVHFGELITGANAGWSPKSEGFPRVGDSWGVLKVSAVSWDKFLPEENKQLLPGVIPPETTQVHTGDFLISRANTTELVAKCVVVNEEPQNLILSDKIVRLQISEGCSKRFLCMINNHAEHARSHYAKEATGTSVSMKNVSRSVIYSLAIPLPPLAEQHRIVAKVDELMALCDQLETQLTTTETDSRHLLEGVLNDALGTSALP